MPAGQTSLLLVVHVREGTPRKARELLNAYTDELTKAIQAWAAKELKREQQRLRDVEVRARSWAAHTDDLRDKRTKLLLELGPWHGVNAEKRLAALSERKLELELELAGTKAEVEAYDESKAKAGARAAELAKGDAMLKNLREIVALRETQYASTEKMHNSGRSTGAELAAAKEAWLKAKVDIARRVEELAQAAGGPQAGELGKQREILAIILARKQAELAEVNRRLKALSDPELLKTIRWMEQLDRQLRLAEQQHQKLTRDLQTLRERLSRIEPVRLTVIGAKEPEASSGKKTQPGVKDVNRSEP